MVAPRPSRMRPAPLKTERRRCSRAARSLAKCPRLLRLSYLLGLRLPGFLPRPSHVKACPRMA